MPGPDSRTRPWSFSRGGETIRLETKPRLSVSGALTIHRLVSNGAGLGGLEPLYCAPQVIAGRLVHLFPDWSPPAVEVNLIFPSRRELSPVVRVFVDYMKQVNGPGILRMNDPLAV